MSHLLKATYHLKPDMKNRAFAFDKMSRWNEIAVKSRQSVIINIISKQKSVTSAY